MQLVLLATDTTAVAVARTPWLVMPSTGPKITGRFVLANSPLR